MLPVRTLTLVITASGSGERLAAALTDCRRLQPDETIVVAHPHHQEAMSTAASFGCAFCPDRSAGKGVWPNGLAGIPGSSGDVLLFVDADEEIELAALRRLLEPVAYGGADAAMLSRSMSDTHDVYPPPEYAWAALMNRLAGRTDLRADSLYGPAFALSRRAAAAVSGDGPTPSRAAAMSRLLAAGMRIERRQPPHTAAARQAKFCPDAPAALPFELSANDRRVLADYLDAVAVAVGPPRGGFTDGSRRRDIVRQIVAGTRTAAIANGNRHPGGGPSLYGGNTLSVVVPARNEEATIGPLLREIRRLEPAETIVVAGGSDDRTAQRAAEAGATVVSVPEPLGADCGRAIGAHYASGDILLFADGDIVLNAAELYPFASAVSRGYDVALNDRNHVLAAGIPDDLLTTAIYALNSALGRKELGASSAVAVPFGLSRRALRAIGPECLQCPPKALAACLVSGLKPALAARVRVDRLNRVRPDKHFADDGLSPAVRQMIGDHIEAFHFLHRWHTSGDRVNRS